MVVLLVPSLNYCSTTLGLLDVLRALYSIPGLSPAAVGFMLPASSGRRTTDTPWMERRAYQHAFFFSSFKNSLTTYMETPYGGLWYAAGNVSDRDPAHSGDAAHRAQPAQKLLLEIVHLSNWSEIKNGVSRYIGKVVQKVTCQ